MKFNDILDELLMTPPAGKRAIQDPEAKSFIGKKNSMSSMAQQLRHDGATHMADYEDPEGTQTAFKTLLGKK